MSRRTWQAIAPERRVQVLVEILDELAQQRRDSAKQAETPFTDGLYRGGAGAYENCAQWIREALQ